MLNQLTNRTMEYYADKFAQEQREKAGNDYPPANCGNCYWYDWRCEQCLKDGRVIEDDDERCPAHIFWTSL